MSAERWARLADALTATCPPDVFTVTARNYPGGVSRSIVHRLPSGDLLTIIDQWWCKNPDVWIGYRVILEGSDSIIRREWPITKKRSWASAAAMAAIKMAADTEVDA